MSAIISLFGEPFHKPPAPKPVRVPGAMAGKIMVGLFLVGVAAAVAVRYWPVPAEIRARQGDARGQYELGKKYFELGAPEENWAEGASWIRSAADQGYVKAQTALGLLYLKGTGVEQDGVKAAEWLLKAAEQGCAVAQNELGVLYVRGIGVEKDMDRAMDWFARAAKQGSKVAERNLVLARGAQSAFIPSLKTRDGQVYQKVTLRKIDATGITADHQTGPGALCSARIGLKKLPADLQRLCRAAQGGPAAKVGMTQLGCIFPGM